MPTAVTYARFSSDRQHESSIEAQQDAIAKYAAARGIEIVRQYVDRGISGTTDKRPEFQRLILDLAEQPVDLVLVHKFDRFSRDHVDAAIYTREIKRRGARLVAVAQDFGETNEAIFMELLMQGWAEYYSRNLSSEVIKGRKQNIKKGRHPGGTYPFGYRSDGLGGYQIVEVEAHFVRKLYQSTIEGTPYRYVIEEMRAAGVTGRRGQFLNRANVSSMLKNPIYAGIYDAKAGEERSRIENHHPAIVSREIYEEACKIMEQRKNAGRAAARRYLCAGIVVCGGCGKPMYGHTTPKGDKLYSTYRCKDRCGMRAIRVDELEQIVCAYVNALLSPAVRKQLSETLSRYASQRHGMHEQRAPQIRKSIAQLDAKLNSITQNIASGVLPASVLERLGKEYDALAAQRDLLAGMLEELPVPNLPDIEAYFAEAAEITPDGDPDLVEDTIRRFVEQVIVYDSYVELRCTFNVWLRKFCPQYIPSSIVPLGDPDDDPPPSGSAPSGGSPSGSSSSGGLSSGSSSSGSSSAGGASAAQGNVVFAELLPRFSPDAPSARVSKSHIPVSRSSCPSRRSRWSATASCRRRAAASPTTRSPRT